MSGEVNKNAEPSPLAERSHAKVLFLMMAQYMHHLSEDTFYVAQPRLLREFEKFEQWLRSKGFYFVEDK